MPTIGAFISAHSFKHIFMCTAQCSGGIWHYCWQLKLLHLDSRLLVITCIIVLFMKSLLNLCLWNTVKANFHEQIVFRSKSELILWRSPGCYQLAKLVWQLGSSAFVVPPFHYSHTFYSTSYSKNVAWNILDEEVSCKACHDILSPMRLLAGDEQFSVLYKARDTLWKCLVYHASGVFLLYFSFEKFFMWNYLCSFLWALPHFQIDYLKVR